MKANGLEVENPHAVIDEICENTSDNIIAITESKAKLVYRSYFENTTVSAILSNLGLVVAFITPVITADFKGIMGLTPEEVKAIFVILSAVFASKLIVSVYHYLKTGRNLNEENFIRELKGQEKKQSKHERAKMEKSN